MTTYSLLTDAFVHVRLKNGHIMAWPLPDVLAALVRDEVLAFEALQPHQQQPWHSFLVQLAAMGAARVTDGEIPEDAKSWRNVLLELAHGRETAWSLVVEDVSKPALLQPPIPEGSIETANFKADVPTPDQLDVLITSKNHDVKSQRISHPRQEHWLFSLLTLQTMEGFLGRGNYGIVRMNGGFGNRPMIGLTKSLSWGAWFERDVRALLAARDKLAERYDPHGYALLWLEPWDGGKESGIPLDQCDPYFLEICRRIRLTSEDDVVTCWRANSSAQRVAAPDDLNGATGDPWTPVDKAAAKALTVSESGFTYDLLRRIIFSGDFVQPAALAFQDDERNGAYLVAQTMVRGQGKTDGLHRRIVPISKAAARRLFSEPTERERLANRAQQRVDLAQKVQRSVLYPAIAALLSSGREEKVDWDRVAPWIDAFDRSIDARFFESLWASVNMEKDAADCAWQTILWEEAQRQFSDAEGGTPIAALHRWRARSKAHSIFQGSARNVLNHLFDSTTVNQSDEEVTV